MKSKRDVLIFTALSLFLILNTSFILADNNQSSSSNPFSIKKITFLKSNYGNCVMSAVRERKDCVDFTKETHTEYLMGTRTLNLGDAPSSNSQSQSSLRMFYSTILKDDRKSCKDTFDYEVDLCNKFKCKGNTIFIDNKCVNP
jgi:hypothetical protein